MNLTKISEIREIMAKFGFSFSKSLGQNFLINSEIPKKIAAYSGADKDTVVLEIGPGIGCLTYELAKSAKKVIAIEIDKRLIPVLDYTLGEFDNIDIINADVMKFNLTELCNSYNGNIVVCANLPYYITTPIIMLLLEENLPIKSITVMVQKEVSRRLCAHAGTKEYGAVTAAIEYYCDSEILFDVSSGSFLPAPKVDSSVIKLNLKEKRCDKETEKILFRLIKSGFEQRRKMLSNAITREFKIEKQMAIDIITKSGYREDIRPEKIDITGFITIAKFLKETIK